MQKTPHLSLPVMGRRWLQKTPSCGRGFALGVGAFLTYRHSVLSRLLSLGLPEVGHMSDCIGVIYRLYLFSILW